MLVPLRIYYDKATGTPIEVTGNFRDNWLTKIPTIDEDIVKYKSLSERNRETFDVLELPYGAYAQDFAQCNGYRVNPETKELEFSYPDPNATEPQEPVYVRPLTEQISELEQQNAELLLDLAMKDARISEMEQSQAELILDLTMKGVI